MVHINEKLLCENCFEEVKISHCPNCGYDPSDSICDPTLLLPGSVLSEKYIIGGVIGKGGFGVTYLAYDKTRECKVALKEYFPRGVGHRASNSTEVIADDGETFDMGAERFYREAKLVSDLSENPNIVKIYDIFRANNTVYLVMEFLRGKTIKEYLRDRGVLDAPSVTYIVHGVLNALSAAHGANVLHRDISPDNVILCADGGVKLIDFGAARQIVDERTQNFSAIVKHGFASPEQYSRGTDQGAWSDIYSLGSTMYYALTGDIPADPVSRFDNDDTYDENNFGIDDGLWNIITKATKLNSAGRYRSVDEMRKALERLPFEPKAVTFPDEGIFRPVFRSRTVSETVQSTDKEKGFWGKHYRLITIAAVSFASAVVLFCVLFALNGGRPNAKPYPSEMSGDISSDVSGAVSSDVSDDVSSEVSGDVSDESSSDISEPETPPVPLTETFPYFGEYESKAWYLGLDEKKRAIYKIIYDGLSEGEKLIKFPDYAYTFEEVQECYYACIYDNPWICNVGDFTKNYLDANGNKRVDPDEYIGSIQPDYFNFVMDADAFREQIENAIGGAGDAETLCRVHDAMVRKVSVVARYINQSCTHAYGSIVHKVADDMGFAQGFCVYAQAMGLPCRVIDGTVNGEVRAWCAVKLEDTWYNVDVYGDLFMQSAIRGTIRVDRNTIFHTCFLVNDEYFKEMGYMPNGGWEALGSEEFAASSPFDNYYIQCIEGADEYFHKDAQSAYDSLLRQIGEAVENGGSEASACVAPYLVDDLYDLMEERFAADCSEKLEFTIKGYNVTCSPQAYTVTVTL